MKTIFDLDWDYPTKSCTILMAYFAIYDIYLYQSANVSIMQFWNMSIAISQHDSIVI